MHVEIWLHPNAPQAERFTVRYTLGRSGIRVEPFASEAEAQDRARQLRTSA